MFDHLDLTRLVRTSLGRPSLRVGAYGQAPVEYPLINPIAGGIHRFTGVAADGSRELPWSLILKIAQPPAGGMTPRGVAPAGWAEDSGHWNYWRREPLLYERGVLARLVGPVVAPRCFAVEEHPGPSSWLWLEDVRDDGDPTWPLARYSLVANHFGRMAGRPPELPAAPWLATGWLRSWVDDVWGSLRPVIRTPEAWTHPLVRDAFPEPVADRLEALWEERGRFLDTLDTLPQTFNHRDAYPGNLFSRRGQTVAIDWTQAGPGPIGEDIGQIVFPSLLFMLVKADELPRFEAAVLDAYLAGLRAAGFRGDARQVRLGYAASAALHWAFAGAFALRWAENEPLGQTMARRWNRPLEAIVRQRAAITYYLLRLADEARAML